MSDAQRPINHDGVREKQRAVISRHNFLTFLAPLPLLPIVGPHMLLSERPTQLGWMPRARTYQTRMPPVGATRMVLGSTGNPSPSGCCLSAISNGRSCTDSASRLARSRADQASHC